MSGPLLIGDHPDGALRFAYVAETRFTVPAVAASRMGAVLRPYPDEAAARAALTDVGASNVRRADGGNNGGSVAAGSRHG